MTFEFATATRIIFGRGSVRQLPQLVHTYGGNALFVTGRDASRSNSALQSLHAAGICVSSFSIQGEPTLDEVRRGAEVARETHAQVVIGFGGGSAVDAGKAIAALATQPQDVLHYIEVIGKGQPLVATPLPYIAVPTTAGTGAEVTRNAVLSSHEHGVKASLRHTSMLPLVALVDAELARECPPAITAASGMDALTQCLEAYVSARAQPMTDALCIAGIQHAARSLEKCVVNGNDLDAREDMALAAMFSGMALANAGLGAVHGFAAPIGGSFHAPHGAVCAILLAPVWAANLAAITETKTRERFQAAARLLTSNSTASAESAIPWLCDLTTRLCIPGLQSYGISESRLPDIATQAALSSSMKGNPVVLPHETLVAILRRAL
ncbi:MAG: iron-containing alcohol dehydrogenase [Prosthecobacter sp.]